MDDVQTAIVVFLVLAGIGELLVPVLHYVIVGWRAKRNDIMDGLNAEARLAYFNMFSRSDQSLDLKVANTKFEKLYSNWYGRRFFLVPGLLLLLTGFLAVTLVVLSSLNTLHYIANPLFNLPEIAIAALAGAYLWVVNDFTSRARRLDFAPSDVLWGVLRLIIAIPMGYAFAHVTAETVGPFVAFALGAFPLATLTSMLQRLANKSLSMESTTEEVKDDIIKLQGINRAIVERLSNEDITTITQIAYCDPVRLIMRSNLTFNFVTDCMNQALAWMYLQNDLVTIRPLGMRGAVEIKSLIDDFDGVDINMPGGQADHDRAVAAFPSIAAAIKQDPATLQITFRQIAEDPYTEYLSSVWT